MFTVADVIIEAFLIYRGPGAIARPCFVKVFSYTVILCAYIKILALNSFLTIIECYISLKNQVKYNAFRGFSWQFQCNMEMFVYLNIMALK